MANIETKKRVSYTEDGRCEITEIYADGDLFQIKEEYFDENGDLIYQYINDKTTVELLREHNKKDKDKNKPNKHKNDKNKSNKFMKKLEKNRKRG